MSEEAKIDDDAAHWHLAVARDDMDWTAFTAWLEADPRHRACYDQFALADALLDTHRAELVDAIAEPAPSVQRWRWAAALGAVAAAGAALLVVPGLRTTPATIYATADTARTIALADGSQIELAPHSRLAVAGPAEATMHLDGGALFAIRHDPARALTITAGALQVSDIGTRFDIQAEGDAVRVAVAEGRVSVSSPALAQAVMLERGRGLRFAGAAGTAELGMVDPDTVAGWRHGQLSYDDAPLALVVADLARYANIHVALPAELRNRRFSGTLSTGNANEALRDLAQLMGLELVRGPAGDRLALRRR
jgi:transmembrane sensor